MSDRSEQGQNYFLHPSVSGLRILDQFANIVNRSLDCAFLAYKDGADSSWGDCEVHKEGVAGLGAGEQRRRNQILLELSKRIPIILIPLKALRSMEDLEE